MTTVAGKTFEFTVTAQDNTTTKTYYVTVLDVESVYTLKITNSNSADARVTVGDKSVTLSNGETSDVLQIVKADDTVKVTVKLNGGGTVTLNDGSTSTVWDNGDGTFDVYDFTNDTTLEIA